MEKIIHKLINEFTEGVDTYTHNNSTWLIFTETKQWVIELTENKTLWYNYNFFKSVFAYASLDCVQNQHLITKWVEDNIINKELTYVTLFRDARDRKHQFEDTLENGVKHTKMAHMKTDWSVDDTIENGVKETLNTEYMLTSMIEDTIQNGVKETLKLECCEYTGDVDEVLENGVKETQFNSYENKSWVEGVIKKGVKETKSDDFNVSQFLCEEVIDKGVKETKQKDRARLILDIDGRGLILETNLVIRDGVKETNHVDVMKFFDNKMEDTLENGVKSSRPRQYVGENIIDKIIDKGVIETHREICEYKHTVEHIIQTGVKETIECDWNIPKYVINEVISEGVKETYDDEYHHKGRIDGVIKNGVKKTMAGNYTDPSTSLLHIKWEAQIEDVIDNGNKVCGTYVGGHRQEEKTETVIEYGKQI